MTTIECSSCRKKPLSKDEVGVCKKMLGKGTKKFFCLDCFASYLDTTVEELMRRSRNSRRKAASCSPDLSDR